MNKKNLIVVGVCLFVAGACIWTIKKYGMKKTSDADDKSTGSAKKTGNDIAGANAGKPTPEAATILNLNDLKLNKVS